jgi:bifunctional UDP-N-acetylglucosamine pyrophosphorylase/glucosamine-1-phosphate N-acetyltransferase
MRPLTLTTPKPLIEAAGVPLIERIVMSLPAAIDSLVVVVGYRANMIMDRYPHDIAGKPVTYVTQEKVSGTFDALMCARPLLAGPFLVVLGDDLQSRRGFESAVTHPLCVIAYEHPHPERFGVIMTNEDGILTALVEKPEHPQSSLISTGTMVLDGDIFEMPIGTAPNGERYLSEALSLLAQKRPVAVVRTPRWVPVGTLEELAAVEALFAAGDDPTV